MGKKARVYRPGDYVFAKVKGYPAWPAKIVSLNGKKYNIYFYGTGETANLPANDIFDYFEHKQKFLEKVLKRRDYNEGLAQIEQETAELGLASNGERTNVADESVDVSRDVDSDRTADTTALSEAEMDTTAPSAPPPSTPSTPSVTPPSAPKTSRKRSVETPDEDEPRPKTGKFDESETTDQERDVPETTIARDENDRPEKENEDEESAKEPTEVTRVTNAVKTPVTARGRKSTNKSNSTPRTPRRSVKQEVMSPEYEPHVPAPESVSRSGRKIKPKRYLDEESTDIQTLQTPSKKIKTLPATPASNVALCEDDEPDGEFSTPADDSAATVPTPVVSEAEIRNETEPNVRKGRKKGNKQPSKCFNLISEKELEKFLENGDDEVNDSVSKNTVLTAVLPSGKVVGVKIDRNYPERVSEETRTRWKSQTIKNILRIKQELENGQVKLTAISSQVETELGLSQDEITNIRKDKEDEVKKRIIKLLKIECRLLELVKSIKSALKCESADTETCIVSLDEIISLDITKMMLLKNVKVVEAIQRLQKYVGCQEKWNLTEEETEKFNKDVEIIVQKSGQCFDKFKEIFNVKDAEQFDNTYAHQLVVLNVLHDSMTPDDFTELVDEPPELLQNCSFNTDFNEEKQKNSSKDSLSITDEKSDFESKDEEVSAEKELETLEKSPEIDKEA